MQAQFQILQKNISYKMNNNLLKIKDKINSKIFFNYNIGKRTWFGTGGNAKIYVIVENSKELEIILNEITNDNFYIIGLGSNLLIRDKGYDGVIIKLGKGFNSIKKIENKLEVGASVADINLSKFAFNNNIEGFEFFSGIPGSIGGAIKMNAGCFGSETSEVVDCLEVYNGNFEKKIIKKDEIQLNYRSSSIKNNQIISKVFFKYSFGNSDEIKAKMDSIKKSRLLTQPIKNKTSGSTFKNPANFYAAKLIEETGCKGMTFGNAFVSDKHANFLINNGKATASDLENLGKKIIDKVYNKYQIKLEWEIKIIGEK